MSLDQEVQPEPAGTGAAAGSLEMLIGFGRVLRQAGVSVTADRNRAFLTATTTLGSAEPSAVYWAGRATLCSSPTDLLVFDRAFEAWFGAKRTTRSSSTTPPRTVRQAAFDQGPTGGVAGEELAVASASEVEVLRRRDIAGLDASDRARMRRLFDTLLVRPPVRRSHRRRPARRGEVDLRHTMRRQLRSGGELTRLARRAPRTDVRPVLLLIDVSGSMEPYADALLRLAHAITRAAPRRTETFTLATRLTRVTPAVRTRDPDEAIARAGALVPDWSGGTRLGELLRAFNDRWGQRGLARGSVVVIISDGWERGDPELLGEQVARLGRLSHRLIWMNPHRGKDGYRPVQGGISASLPHLDHFLAGHSMNAFEALLRVLADA